jgi:hypothetical protein
MTITSPSCTNRRMASSIAIILVCAGTNYLPPVNVNSELN